MKIYLDTNIFLYAIFANPVCGPACKSILEEVEQGKTTCFLSPLVPLELLAVTLKESPEKVGLALDAFYSLTLSFLPIARETLVVASRIATRYNLTGYDALHLATAIQASLDRFITNDHRLRRVKEIKVITPIEYSSQQHP